MFGLIFVIQIIYLGNLIHNYFLGKESKEIGFPSFFLLGSIFSVSFVAILSLPFHNLRSSLIVFEIFSIPITFFTLKHSISKIQLKPGKIDILKTLLLLLIFYFFEKSLSYNSVKNIFLISSNLYQDMGAHIPIIRYFSSSSNISFEIPFFAGGSILYHFVFDFYAGILVFLGLRIDYALSVLGSLSLFSFLIMLFNFAKSLYKDKYIGLIACVLFIFNSDLSFIQLFQKYGFNISSYYHQNEYLKENFLGFVSRENFLNVNVLLNQRHLIFGLLILLYVLFIIVIQKKLSNKKIVLLSLLVGLLPFWHLTILISTLLLLSGLFISFKDLRGPIIKIILLSAIFFIPQVLLIKFHSVNQITYQPGFIIWNDLNFKNFLLLWIWNIGFSIPLGIYGFIKSNSSQRKIFLVFAILFVVANVFRFSIDIFDNHKFFNVWVLSIDMLVATGIVFLIKQKLPNRLIGYIGFLLVIASGLLNVLVAKNDVRAQIPDYKKSNLMIWTSNHTKIDSIYLTNGEIYDPVSVAGLRLFLGWPRYIYLYGGDPDIRSEIQNKIFLGKEKNIKRVLGINHVSYIIIYKRDFAKNLRSVNIDYLNSNLKRIYENNEGIIFKV